MINDAQINVTCSTEMKTYIKNQADINGMSVNSWIRMRCKPEKYQNITVQLYILSLWRMRAAENNQKLGEWIASKLSESKIVNPIPFTYLNDKKVYSGQLTSDGIITYENGTWYKINPYKEGRELLFDDDQQMVQIRVEIPDFTKNGLTLSEYVMAMIE